MKKVISTKTMNLINALFFLIAGVLFCISTSLGERWIGIVIGVDVLLIGVIAVAGELVKENRLVSRTVVVGSVFIAIGIYLIVDQSLLTSILGLIPYLLIVAGVCVAIDAFLLKFVRDKKNTAGFIVELVLGIALLVGGILILTVPSFKNALGIFFGVALILYAVYLLVTIVGEKKKSSSKK